MGVVTISLSQAGEKLLRKLAAEKYPGQKGAMAKVVEEGLIEVADKKTQEAAKKRFFEIAKKGFNLGGGPYWKDRSELYEREPATD